MTVPDDAADAPLDFNAPPDRSTALPACSSCSTPITGQYWSVGPAVLCDSCREALEQGREVSTDVSSRTARFTRALVYGVGGMLAGSAIWYGVARLADLEVGLIAILLGFLVGRGVFLGSGKRGGRRYQVLAVVLTYLGIGLAYVPFAIDAMRKDAHPTELTRQGPAPTADRPAAELSPAEAAREEARLDSVIAAQEQRARDPAESRSGPGPVGILALLGVALVGVLTLPLVVTIGGLPGSIISLAIYGFAVMEAWKLTRRVHIPVTGPFKVGGAATA
jgi:hypothetical protein